MDKEDGLIREKPAVLLLKHIHELWPTDAQFWPTSDLVDLLAWSHPTVWGPEGPFGKKLTVQRLGKMLVQGYKINSDREGHGTPRGYFRSAFNGVWNRMGVNPSQETGSTGESGETGEPEPDIEPESPEQPDEPVTEGRFGEPDTPAATNGYRSCYDCGDPVGSGIARCRPCFNKATAP